VPAQSWYILVCISDRKKTDPLSTYSPQSVSDNSEHSSSVNMKFESKAPFFLP